jgi:gas vesicle protein
MTMADNDRGVGAGGILVAFLAGAAIGTGLALLYAPKSGRDTRQRLRDLADDSVDRIKGYVDEAEEKIVSAYEQGRDVVRDKKSMVLSAIEAGKEAMERERDRQRKEKA